MLLLPSHLCSELLPLGIGPGYPGDPLLPETQIDTRGFLKCGGEASVIIATGQPQKEQRIAGTCLDLGREHSRCCAPGLPLVISSLQDQDLPAGRSEFPGAGGAHGPAADHQGVMRHCVPVKLFGTSRRTAA